MIDTSATISPEDVKPLPPRVQTRPAKILLHGLPIPKGATVPRKIRA